MYQDFREEVWGGEKSKDQFDGDSGGNGSSNQLGDKLQKKERSPS
jgi:hypothetical protein